jgi:hypothetical protein
MKFNLGKNKKFLLSLLMIVITYCNNINATVCKWNGCVPMYKNWLRQYKKFNEKHFNDDNHINEYSNEDLEYIKKNCDYWEGPWPLNCPMQLSDQFTVIPSLGYVSENKEYNLVKWSDTFLVDINMYRKTNNKTELMCEVPNTQFIGGTLFKDFILNNLYNQPNMPVDLNNLLQINYRNKFPCNTSLIEMQKNSFPQMSFYYPPKPYKWNAYIDLIIDKLGFESELPRTQEKWQWFNQFWLNMQSTLKALLLISGGLFDPTWIAWYNNPGSAPKITADVLINPERIAYSPRKQKNVHFVNSDMIEPLAVYEQSSGRNISLPSIYLSPALISEILETYKINKQNGATTKLDDWKSMKTDPITRELLVDGFLFENAF